VEKIHSRNFTGTEALPQKSLSFFFSHLASAEWLIWRDVLESVLNGFGLIRVSDRAFA
jgi:hypothetical protein